MWMHGPMFPIGGWWKTLELHFLDTQGTWQSLPYTITPSYDMSNLRNNRHPFEAFACTFMPVQTRGLRLFGIGGGSMGVVTMRFMHAGLHQPADIQQALDQIRMAPPPLYALLPPAMLWGIIDGLRQLTGITFDAQSTAGLGLDHFLNEADFAGFHQHTSEIYDTESLYQVFGQHDGWDQFGSIVRQTRQTAIRTGEAAINEHHGGMVWMSIPVIVNGEAIGTLENRNLIIRDQPDATWHANAPARYDLAPDHYAALLAALPVLSHERINTLIRLIQQIIDLAQQRIHEGIHVEELRSTVEELAVPILPIWQDVLVVPLIGTLRHERALQLTSIVLQRVHADQARIMILDLTGVTLIDEQIVVSLVSLVQTLRLIGATCFLSGVRPDMALALIHTDSQLIGVATFANLRSALAVAIEQVRK